jgi:hypothetical protein
VNQHEHSPHDNIDVRFQNRMSFHHSRVTIFFIPIILVGGFIFGTWVFKFPSQYLAAVPLLIWATFGLMAAACFAGLLAFVLHFIGKPITHLLLDTFETILDIRLKWYHRNYLDSTPTAVTYLDGDKVTTTPVIQERHVHQHKEQPQPLQEPLQLEPPIPAFVRYEEIRGQIPFGHTLLGIGAGGKLETRPFSVLDTLWICGGSKTGKTNTIGIKVEEGHQVGRKLLVCDPHKTKSDSLYNAIRGYERDFLLPVAHRREEIMQAIQTFKAEAERRIAGGQDSDGWTLIVDEVGALTGSAGMRTEEQTDMYRLLAPVARMCGEQLRGYKMSGWFISQSPLGLSWLNSCMTVIVHKLLKENQQKVATNNNSVIMDGMANWPRGRVFVYGLDLQGEYLLQQPLFTPAKSIPVMEPLFPNPSIGKRPEVNGEAAGSPFEPSQASKRSNGRRVEANGEAGGSTFEPSETSELSNGRRVEANGEAAGSTFEPLEAWDETAVKILRDIGKRLQNGESRADIVKRFGLPYGRATRELKAVVDFIADEGASHGD